MIVIFNSAFLNDDYAIVDDRKNIAKTYLQGWFLFDVIAIIPFDTIFQYTSYNKFARIVRVGRLYKLVKLTKLFRFLKILKEKNKLMKLFTEYLKIGVGFERMAFFVLVFVVLCHITACLWLIIAALENPLTYQGTWY